MSMILPYHDIASAAAFAEASVCATRPSAPSPSEDTPLFLTACGHVSPVYEASRWAKLLGAVLSPISGPKLSRSGNGASNI